MSDPKRQDDLSLDELLAQAAADEPIDLGALAEDEAGTAGVSLSEDDALHDELDAIRAERDDMRDRFMRALADAENARKRGDRDRREAEQYGGSKLARDLLPIFDNLTRALEAAGKDGEKAEAGEALVQGVELTLRELVNIFGKHGIAPIVPEVGEKFDPQLHQAMFEAPLPDTKAGDIIQVMTHGFMLHDRLLRPSQVGVSSNPAK